MLYSHSPLPLPEVPVRSPVLLQAPWPYSGTATYGGQTAPLYTPSGR
jgi:hypothetical protein